MRDGEFRDPRLVDLYDLANLPGPDTDFFRRVAAEQPRSHIVDIGCGTGQLTALLAADGHIVVGVDPATESLRLARARTDAVTWVLGSATDLPDDRFDLAVMSSHVAQFLASDDEWESALLHIAAHLVPRGRLTFDSRDPRDRRWEQWSPATTRTIHLTDTGLVEHWTEVIEIEPRPDGGSTVTFIHHYRFDDGDERDSTSTMAFRTEESVRRDLLGAGFDLERLFGGWAGEPVGHPDGELIVIARLAR